MDGCLPLHLCMAALLLLSGGCSHDRPVALPTHAASQSALQVTNLVSRTLPGLGKCQGAAKHEGFVYLYGDADPGVIRQYRVATADPPSLVATDVKISLTLNGDNLINHPTGLTWNPQFGLYLGNTVTATTKGTIYHLDWTRMLTDGNLDHAILNVIDDDLAAQGCRPEFVRRGDRWLLATADYGDRNNHVRFYDPERLATAHKTSESGVLVADVASGPFVQQLHWIDEWQILIIVQNQTAGQGWRLVAVNPWTMNDFSKAEPFDDFPRRDELEGFTLLSAGRCILVTSSSENNVSLGDIRIP
jgi:hypothetical protein